MIPLRILVILIIVCFPLFADGQKTNIAVLDLDGTGLRDDDVQFLSNRLRTELFETGKFNVLERDQMNAILKEQGFQQSGCTTIDCAVEIGQLLNVQQMVGGSIGKIDDIYSITLRLIDVKSGAIIKTATRDHEGKLSTMLTEVIPVVSQLLAFEKEESDEIKDVKKEEITEVNKTGKDPGFVFTFKGGLAFAQYTIDNNDAVSSYNATTAIIDLPEYSNHANFALEVGYFLSDDWELKLGVMGMPQISEWVYKNNNNRFNRTYSFTNSYFGCNYYFWSAGEKYDFFIGFDIGSFQMNANTEVFAENLTEFAEKWDNNYETSRVASKLSLGGLYTEGNFKFGAEFTIRIFGNHFTRTKDPAISTELFEIVFPREINASGSQLSLIVSYDI